MKKGTKGIVIPTIKLAFKNFFKHGADKEAAALAYYLLFAFFPMSIFISNLIGLLQLDIIGITSALYHIMPKAVVSIIEAYLEYVTHASSTPLLLFSLVFSIYFPMRAVKVLMDNVHKAYQLGKPHDAKTYMIRQLVFTLLLLFSIFMILSVLTLGERVVQELVELFSNNTIKISEYVMTIWVSLRYIIVAALMLLVLTSLYSFSLDRKQPMSYVLPGIIVSFLVWIPISFIFSYYAENFTDYSVFYGTLGAVIMLLVWLYLTAMVLLLGLEINGALVELQPYRNERYKFRRVIED